MSRREQVFSAPTPAGPYSHDPEHSCADRRTLRAVPREFIADPLAAGWRYRSAAQGPDGTTSGTLWLDGNGLLLGYRGRIRNRRDERSLRVDTVSYEPVPADAFEPPEGLRTPGTAAPRR
ncbi:hypothetical protein AB8810_01785 [Xanthomonas sp. NCPPB 3005]|uniref:hypothetical protein n=1 Tax=Xanthomonas sp. NCPPB 3005 TaxID=3240913 RepID=UPI003515BF65